MKHYDVGAWAPKAACGQLAAKQDITHFRSEVTCEQCKQALAKGKG